MLCPLSYTQKSPIGGSNTIDPPIVGVVQCFPYRTCPVSNPVINRNTGCCHFREWCAGKDSNLRSPKTPDLQSGAIAALPPTRGGHGGTRTPNLRFRRPTLHPIELHTHILVVCCALAPGTTRKAKTTGPDASSQHQQHTCV